MPGTDRVVERTPSPETPDEIIARLTAENAEFAQQIVSLKLELATARSEATVDHLTGLPNPKTIELELGRQLALLQRNGGSIAVALFDLDNFKLVNDTYGHPQGDAVLKGFADRIRSGKRESDVFGRHGGEEFLAVFPIHEGMSFEDIEKLILDRYHKLLTSLNRTGRETEFIPQTVSVGCVVIGEERGFATVQEAIAAADILLYQSKAGGRNRSTIAKIEDVNLASEK